jgi:bacterioferritin (cytochrome b1)
VYEDDEYTPKTIFSQILEEEDNSIHWIADDMRGLRK